MSTPRILGLLATLGWIYQATGLYPLPPGDIFLFGADALERELWTSWWLALGSFVFGVTFSVLVLAGRFQIFGLFISSMAFVFVWWFTSGVVGHTGTVREYAIGRWYLWPKLLLQKGDIAMFIKVVLNEYVLFGLYHFVAGYSIAKLTQGQR